MPRVNVSEADFEAVAGAAMDAQLADDMAAAHALDKLARKINAALSGGNIAVQATTKAGMTPRQSVRWQDMPSVLLKPDLSVKK